MKMKIIILATTTWMAFLSPVDRIEAAWQIDSIKIVRQIEPVGWQINQDVNNNAGTGGNLQDLSSVNLTDCCGDVLFAR